MKLAESIVLFVVVLNISLPVTSAPASYVYMWVPRSEDVSGPGTPQYVLLEALLRLARTRSYTVVRGDSLDYIVRKSFLVSQVYKNAYGLYLRRVFALNPGVSADSPLPVGGKLTLPSGPKFGGTELGGLLPTRRVQDKMFSMMSQNAYSLAAPSADRIQRFATRSLGHYVSPTGGGDIGSLFKQIKNRGLIWPVDLSLHPEFRLSETEALVLNVEGAAEPDKKDLTTVIKADPQRILPGMFPVSDSQPVSCSGPCIGCGAILHVPQEADLTRVRILVEDTGVSTAIVDSRHVLFSTTNDGGADASQQRHGTFVYSQVAAPSGPNNGHVFGIIPSQNVYAAKAVQTVGATDYFAMADIMNGWKAFSALTMADGEAAATRVVNISAFGEPVLDPDHPPSIPNDGHLLFIAAAGNNPSGGTESAPALAAFDRLSNGSTPLIIVGALASDGSPAKYSNFNSMYVQLFAPGDCVCGAPGQINGTSQAAPFVTVAAGVLASARPTWSPLWVMWRLLATADHPPSLRQRALAGTLNLARALDAGIVVSASPSAGAPLTTFHATSIVYDASWKAAFAAQGINHPGKETLRLSEPTADGQQVCFTALQFLYYTSTSLCVPKTSKVSLGSAGATTELVAGNISDIVLPMPIPYADESGLPNIDLTSQ